MKTALLAVLLAACGSTPKPPAPAPTPVVVAPSTPDPIPNDEPPPRILNIDWAKIHLVSDDDANALWAQIAPTGEDWQEKLDEVPAADRPALAIALLRAGNFTCAPAVPRTDCAPMQYDVPDATEASTFTDPCLRRILAMWALDAVPEDQIDGVMDPLRAIVAIPPPESELVAAAIHAVPETQRANRMDLLGRAVDAGQSDVVGDNLTTLDEAGLKELVVVHHSADALTVLSAESARDVYLAAVIDAKMPAAARTSAMADLMSIDLLDTPSALKPDLRKALATATEDADCDVAAVAIRALATTGDKHVLPKKPKNAAQMMRALCLIASYEKLQGADEASLLGPLVPAKGLEVLAVAYDPFGETDEDGDGNIHTTRELNLIPKNVVGFPSVTEIAKALRQCDGTSCRSKDLDVHFVLRGNLLARIEVFERPPCITQ